MESLGPNWARFGNLSLQYKKDFGANSICKASDAERVKIFFGSVLGDMESDLILVGRAMDDSNQVSGFYAIHDPSSENRCWASFCRLWTRLHFHR